MTTQLQTLEESLNIVVVKSDVTKPPKRRWLIKTKRNYKHPFFICEYERCFYDGIINDIPFICKCNNNFTRHYHVPCAMVLNII